MHEALSILGQEMSEDGAKEDHVERAIGKREPVPCGCDLPSGVVRTARQVRVVKAERRLARCDRSATPVHGFLVDLDPVVGASEIADQADREVADARADVEHAMLRLESREIQLGACVLARAGEALRPPRPVVVDAEVRWRQQGIVPPWRDPIEQRQPAMGSGSQRLGGPLP